MNPMRATAVGFVAVLLWALLALLTVGTDPMPPLLVNAVAMSIGALVGAVWTSVAGGFRRLAQVPPIVFAFGVLGLFGYHFLYFSALRLAPAAEASLIAYLWPLLIVLMSGLLPGERLRAAHLVGALTAFAGAALILAGPGGWAGGVAWRGYALALGCALTWSSYSVLSRRWRDVPTSAVTVFCAGAAALSWVAHAAFETTTGPSGSVGWLSLVLLGLGPVGLAFYLWDVGVKRGQIQLVGTVAYAAPLLSTLVLVLAGRAQSRWQLYAAAALIAGGALIAALPGLTRKVQE